MIPAAFLTFPRVYRALQEMLHEALAQSCTGKITIVDHSAGGVMARVYLSPEPFEGRAYRGLAQVDRLVMLGGPHHNQRVGRTRQWVNERYPGAYFAPHVRYVSVAGKLIRDDRRGSAMEPLGAFCLREVLQGWQWLG